MTIDKLGDYLKQHWPVIREQLLNGIYEPKPVRRVEIQKPDGGGVRKLGIPTHQANCTLIQSSFGIC
jgi:RNA-directed DNA polymerase